MTDARAAIVREHKKPLSLETVRINGPLDNEVFVRLVSSGICHTDMVFHGGFAVPTPCILGHEGDGVAEAIGSAVPKVEVGDHVILSVLWCRECYNYTHGHPTFCEHNAALNYSGGRSTDGLSPVSKDGERINAAFFSQSSFATYSIADERNTVVVDKKAPLHLLGPLSC